MPSFMSENLLVVVIISFAVPKEVSLHMVGKNIMLIELRVKDFTDVTLGFISLPGYPFVSSYAKTLPSVSAKESNRTGSVHGKCELGLEDKTHSMELLKTHTGHLVSNVRID